LNEIAGIASFEGIRNLRCIYLKAVEKEIGQALENGFTFIKKNDIALLDVRKKN
jgi:hypothetical protein